MLFAAAIVQRLVASLWYDNGSLRTKASLVALGTGSKTLLLVLAGTPTVLANSRPTQGLRKDAWGHDTGWTLRFHCNRVCNRGRPRPLILQHHVQCRWFCGRKVVAFADISRQVIKQVLPAANRGHHPRGIVHTT